MLSLDGVKTTRTLVILLFIAAAFFVGALYLRGRQTAEIDVTLCEAQDHFAQIQEAFIAESPTLSEGDKVLRINVLENYRDELGCRDQLDPDVIRALVRG